MNESNRFQSNSDVKESILFGIVGAFLFSLAGGALYLILNRIGYIASLSGLVTVVCAIKGYTFFAKKEGMRGTIISVVVATVVLVLSWYVAFCLDMVDAYEIWYANGEVPYAPELLEYIPYGVYDLEVNPSYFTDLFMSLAFAAFGCWRYVASILRAQKQPVAPVPDCTPENSPAEETAPVAEAAGEFTATAEATSNTDTADDTDTVMDANADTDTDVNADTDTTDSYVIDVL